jgi:hypothetical protein
MTGTWRYQLRPTVEASADIRADMFGGGMETKAIVTDDAIYFDIGQIPGFPAVPGEPGKPWIKVGIAGLKATGGGGLAELAQAMQISNPSVQVRLSQLATNTRVAGTQTIGGVPTTEYAGSYRADAILKAVPASERKTLVPVLRMLGPGPVYFREWIDGQHRVRKTIVVHTANGTTTTSTVYVTAFNQPVHIAPPPASQIVMEFNL